MQNRKPRFQEIATLKNLPTLPHILLKLIDACNQETSSIKEVSAIVEKDPALCTKILRLVNSAHYGLRHSVENMNQAVALIGIKAVKNIGICASIYESFTQKRKDLSFNLKLFWWHSLKCAVLSRLLAKAIRYSEPDEAFLSGLLHDIGKLVLWVNFPEQCGELMEEHKDQPESLLADETGLGASHSEVGAWLLEHWNLQSFMVDSVLYHHEPESRISAAFPLVQIVYVANILGREPAHEQEKALKTAKEILGIEEPELERFLLQSDEELQEVAQSLDIEIEPPKSVETPLSEKDLRKQADLVREVQAVSLLLGALQDLMQAEDQNAILQVLRQGLQVLFDVGEVLFFLRDPEKDILFGKTVVQDKKFSVVKDLILPLGMDRSLVIASLRQGKPLNSFAASTDPVAVILDEQIVRYLGKEGIVCLPMSVRQEPVGVIVIGLDKADFSHLSKHFKLLDMFTDQAALALHVDHMRQNRLKTIQSERLSAASTLAREVFHEVNDPLSIIKNYLKVLAIKLSEQNIAQDEIKIINEEIDRVAHILHQLATLSGEEATENQPIDMNALISDLAKIMRESFFKDLKVKFHLDLEPSLPSVVAETYTLKQVFINLIQNAVEAMTEEGNLSIRTRRILTPIEENATGHAETYKGFVEITVSDQGVGIPDEIKDRIFEPFVSSKGSGHRGLGLSAVYNIIKALKGTITFESGRTGGTVFKIELPVPAT